MKIEDRVREALHEYADPIEPDAGSWARITDRFDEPVAPSRPAARRPFALAGIALALVVVIVAALVVRDGGDSSLVVTGPSDTGAGWPSIVAALGNDVVQLDPRTSDVQTTLWKDTGVHNGVRSITPSVDGQSVYVVADVSGPCEGGAEAFRVPLDGGGVRKLTQVSSMWEFVHEGRTLIASTGADCSDDRRVIRYSEGGLPGTTAGAPPEVRFPAEASGVRILDASPSGRRLLVQVFMTTPRLAVVEVPSGTYTYVAPNETAAATFASDNFLTIITTHDGATGPEVITLQGRVVSGVVPWVQGAVNFDSVDSIGDGRLLGVTTDGDLYQEGERVPMPGRVAAATWVPDGPTRPEPTPDPAQLPNGIAVLQGRDLRVIGALDGGQHSSLLTVPEGSAITATTDGETILIGGRDRSDPCDFGAEMTPPALVRFEPFTSFQEPLVGASYSPVVSGKGLVAYGYACDGNGLGFTDLRTGRNYRHEGIGGPGSRVTDVRPLGWSPDGTRLLVSVWLAGQNAPHLLVGRFTPDVPATDADDIEVAGGDRITGATFLDEDTLAVALPSGSGSAVEYRRLAGTGDVPSTFTVPEPVRSLVAGPSGRHLLVVTDAGSLFRWSRDDQVLTKLADGVSSAAWLPWS